MKTTTWLLAAAAVFCIGPGAAAAQTTVHAGPITAVAVARGPSCSGINCPSMSTSSEQFVDVPGAVLQMRLPSASLLVARFTTDSLCDALCSIRILVSAGAGLPFGEMIPAVSGHEGFSFRVQGTQTIERSAAPLLPGLVTVKVQVRVPFSTEPSNVFTLLGWHLTLEAAIIN